jgi:hypothetical protein
MKKTIISGLVASAVMGLAGTALADPINLNGSFDYQFRNNSDKAFNAQFTRERFLVGLNFDGKIDADTTAFGRIAGKVGNWGTAPAGNNDFKLDQFGVKTGLDGWNISVGRQGVKLGQGGVFYAGSDISPLTYFDGIVITSKLGAVNFKALAGNTTDAYLQGAVSPRQKWAGAEISGDIDKDINVGFSYAGKNNVDAKAANIVTPGKRYWSVYTTIKTGDSLSWTGEYVKSNANTANRAYDLSGTYSWPKNSFTVAYNNVQANATDLDNSSIGGEYYPNGSGFIDNSKASLGYKGLTYVYHHDVKKNLGLNLVYLSLKPLNAGNGVTTATDGEFQANLKWKF